MANVEMREAQPNERDPEEMKNKQVISAGGFTEALAGFAAVVLSILGLIGMLPVDFAAIGIIIVAVALLIEGGSIAARFRRVEVQQRTNELELPEIAGGLGAESLAAVAALAMGVLALLRVDIFVLMPVGVIVLGVGMMFGSAAAARMSSIRIAGPGGHDTYGIVAREAVRAASSAHVLVGLAAVLLGIVGLAVSSTITLTLVAVLCLGGAVLLSGAAIGGRLMDALHHA